MEISIIIKAIISLGLVFLVMYAALKLLQKYTKFGYNAGLEKNPARNLILENVVYVDESTKIVTMTYSKERKYILGISKGNLVVIDKITENQATKKQSDIEYTYAEIK